MTKTLPKKATKRKLTLSLDSATIYQSKLLAKKRGTSLSQLIENFLQQELLTEPQPYILIQPDSDILALMAKPVLGAEPQANDSYRDQYYAHLRDRYLDRQNEEE